MRIRVKKDFWPPYFGDGDPNLYADELGWGETYQAEAHSTDTYNIYHFFIYHYGFDLKLYFAEYDEFYYIDMTEHAVYKMPTKEGWNGNYIYERVDESAQYHFNMECVCEFDNAIQLWKDLSIHDKNLKYVIEHSLVIVTH